MTLELELTTKCALQCPACVRTRHPQTVHRGELPPDVFLSAITDKIDHVLLCGCHGDAIYYSHLHAFIDGLNALKPRPALSLITNGSHRTAHWWEQTAMRLSPANATKPDMVTFSIDGLPESNSLYRRGSDWSTLESAIRIVRRQPRRVFMTWKWIVFRYNQDEVVRGYDLAMNLGFDHFEIHESLRQTNPPEICATRPMASIQEELQTRIHKDSATGGVSYVVHSSAL